MPLKRWDAVSYPVGLLMRRLLALSLFAVARTASADSVCITSFEHAQELRQAGKLRDARAELRACAKPDCPAFVQRDCSTWATEVERDLPSLIVATRDAGGQDVVAQLQLDGADVPTSALGDLRVDPGEHDVRATAPGYEPSTTHVVIHLGERRNLTLSLTKIPGDMGVPGPSPLQPSAPPPPRATSSAARTGAWVAGGVALAGLATFGVLAIHGFTRENALASSCSPTCAHDSVQAIRTEYLVGDVALTTGLVAAVVSSVLFVASRGHSPTTTVAWTFP